MISHLLQKKYQKLLALAIFSLSFCFVVSQVTLAAPYGQGAYNSNPYSSDPPNSGGSSGSSSSNSIGGSGSSSSPSTAQTTPTTSTESAEQPSGSDSKNNETQDTTNTETKSSKSNWLYILLGIVSLLLAGVLLFFALRRRDRRNDYQGTAYHNQTYTPNQKDKDL